MTAVLGLDYGLRRIGVAWGTTELGVACAVGTHVEGRDGSILKYLETLIAEREITLLVLGLPLTADGRETEIAAKVRRFAARLTAALDLPVEFWDERFSSVEADRWLSTRKKPTREDRDALAAEIILQNYLDSLRAPEQSLPGEEPS